MVRRAAWILLALVTFATPSLPQSNSAEIAFWQSVESTKDATELEAYLEAYPNGSFAALARIRIEKLKAGSAAYGDGQSPRTTDAAADTPMGGHRGKNNPAVTECDRLAAHPLDLLRVAEGVWLEQILADKAMAACREAVSAHPGTPRFDYQLGRAMHAGQQEADAVTAYRRAAFAGYPMAMTDLGVMYANGTGIAKSDADAVRWYHEAIAADEPHAMFLLGNRYAAGRGVERDDKEALRLLRMAVDKSQDIDAIHALGWVYQASQGVPADPPRAARYIMDALRRGNQFTVQQMTERADIWSKPFRQELQRLLQADGVYFGKIDGVFGPATTSAIQALVARGLPRRIDRQPDAPKPAEVSRKPEAGQDRFQPDNALSELEALETLE
ncbi:hypothetical protein CSC94_22495 [Zhengella mangrovi]|uniref:Peptidoglycan binding-like domain-containing protein n=1 Tax=Zhengella mangrovi TaxID=1982044 RepID=A0A2G1QGY1_9HYPH|nr:SEL1-like repeat protein [Zhengella mangrovi]PHP64773.1 hypothetical protein CSC94_22495 [Zhengella mangrovi]